MKVKTIVIMLLLVLGVLVLIYIIHSKSKKSNLAQKEKSEMTRKAVAAKSTNEYIAWELKSFAAESGDQSNRKYIETNTEGIFSNPITKRGTLYAQVILTKTSAGLLLHKLSKAVPSLKIDGTATITLKNSNLEEVKLSSIESWTPNGGIKVKNHGENKHLAFFDQMKDFMNKSKGNILITITDEASSSYSFYISSNGFSKEFNLL
jgi:hypothetical protein